MPSKYSLSSLEVHKIQKAKRKALSNKKKREKLLAGAMQAVCELMKSFGVPRDTASKHLQFALDRGYSRATSANAKPNSNEITRLADVCTRWHLEREFLDKTGKAKPLTWNGKTGTLLRLVKRVVGAKDSLSVLDELIARRLVAKAGSQSWLPKVRVVAPLGLDDAQIMRSAAMVNRLLRTIAYNSERKYEGDVLLEVMARVPRLPSKQIPLFRRFAKAQGLTFVRSVDDWLETRNLGLHQKAKRQSKEVGVIAFAFVQPASYTNGS
jgi:hypothetical protein